MEILSFHNIEPAKLTSVMKVVSSQLLKKKTAVAQIFTPKNMLSGRVVHVKDTEGKEQDFVVYSISRIAL